MALKNEPHDEDTPEGKLRYFLETRRRHLYKFQIYVTDAKAIKAKAAMARYQETFCTDLDKHISKRGERSTYARLLSGRRTIEDVMLCCMRRIECTSTISN